MSKSWVVVAATCAGLGLGVAASAQELTTVACQEVTGQAQIGGVLQQISGVACLQPDGTWQLMDTGGGGIAYAAPAYYYDPWWYWPPVGFSAGVIFVDHFHHVHHLNHVFFRHGGGAFFVHGGMRGGAPGGFRGGMRGGGGFHGGFHGGGGMHR